MLIVVTYDVNTQTKDGVRRLRHVARHCENYGVRVQNSVFECVLDASEALMMQKKLVDTIDKGKDSLRFYYIGKKRYSRVEHFGVKPGVRVDEPLIL